ncbi:MAG TPA: pentapeptide repeat-containing protein [Terracidiphilus sp.]|nr:pentapeptide repeat-containing protein [Terracidiphilus sp.]
MIIHTPRSRPAAWKTRRQSASHSWLIPFVAIEWGWEWAACALSNWAFLEVLEYLGTFSVLVAVIFYFSESGDRIKQRHYQAWQVINTAQGKGGSGGRIEALQELNHDKVPLVGVDVSSAFLQGLELHDANLLRSDFSSADLRNSNLSGARLTLANLNSANLRGANLDHARFEQADLRNADLNGASLVGADFSDAALDGADLRSANVEDAAWQQIKSITAANIAGVRNAPQGFIEWALKHGAVNEPGAEN